MILKLEKFISAETVCFKELNQKLELYLIQHPVQFICSLNNTISIIAVNNKSKTLGVLEVMSPQRSDLHQHAKNNIINTV